MKRTLAGLLLLCVLLSSCSNAGTIESTQASDSMNDNQSFADAAIGDRKELTDAEIYEIFSVLNKEALPMIFWYMETPEASVDLDISKETDHAPYYKVGKFTSIDEMKAATDAVFTDAFTNTYFYDHAFIEVSGNGPMYKEIDGALYRNADMGGMGWPHQTTDEYYVPYQDEDMIVIAVKCLLPYDEIDWRNFLIRNDNGVWKLDTYFDFNPYMEFDNNFPKQRYGLISNAASSWFCSQTWTDANQLDANSLINFYLYMYLSDIKDEYDYEKGYEVSSKELINGLSVYLKDIKLDTLTAVNENPGANARYDEKNDCFYFDITFDPADYIVINSEKKQDIHLLKIMVIGKSGKAAYLSFLELEVNDSETKLVGNTFQGYL